MPSPVLIGSDVLRAGDQQGVAVHVDRGNLDVHVYRRGSPYTHKLQLYSLDPETSTQALNTKLRPLLLVVITTPHPEP